LLIGCTEITVLFQEKKTKKVHMIAVLFPIANTHALVFPVETAKHIEDLTGK
jgi:diadenosine tetraphosphate (Ap4A) HIT family hydrolase